jgi:Ca2+-binding EF-hand superfamily protein
MDVNNDGVLDEEELINHLTKAIDKVRQDELLKQKEVNAEGVKEIMTMMDDNGDGMLSKEEMFGKTTQSSKQAIADNRMFDFADGAFGHKDGQLDEDEIFIMALPQYSMDRMGWYKFKAQDHMEEMDTDGDDEVSFQEYKDAMELATGAFGQQTYGSKIGGYDKEDAVKKMLFKEADKNGDKKLDLEELITLVKELEHQNMKETVEGLVALADDNGDGKLALSEIINHVSDFGGHMAFFLNDPDLLFPTKKSGLKNSKHTEADSAAFVANALTAKKARVHKASVFTEYAPRIMHKLPFAEEFEAQLAEEEVEEKAAAAAAARFQRNNPI